MASTNMIEIPSSLIDAINGLPDAAFLVMDSGTIIAANVVADKMFGYSHSQLIGSQVDELMPAAARSYHHKVRTGASTDRRLRQFTSGRTFECERRDGEVFQADIMLSPTEIDGVPMTWAIVRDLDAPSEANAGRQQALAALDALGRMAASTFDLQNDFEEVAERLKEVVPHDRIGVALLCEDDPEMVEIAFLSGDDHPAFEAGERVPLSISATSWVVQTKARVLFTKRKSEFAPPAVLAGFEQGYTESCGAPLFDGKTVIGMLMLSTRRERGFSEFQKGLIDRLAAHLSVGIVNQRIRGRLQAKTREIESIGEIGKRISSSPDLNSAFLAACESINRLVPYDRLSVFNIDLKSGEIVGMYSDGDKLPGFDNNTHVLPSDSIDWFREMFDTGTPMVFDRKMIVAIVDAQPSFAPFAEAGYNWALVVPLMVTRIPVGMMVFGLRDLNGYSSDQIAVASRIAEQLAGPVANAFQLAQTRDEAKIESTLARIGAVVDTTFDLQNSKHELGPLIGELVANSSVMISSVTQDGMNLRLIYRHFSGIDQQDGWDVGSIHPWVDTTAELIFHTRKPVLVNAKSLAAFKKLYPGVAPVQSNHAPKSVINVPLITKNEIFGFLTFRTAQRNAYSESDVAMSVRIGARLTGSVALSELRWRDTELANERAVLASIGGLLGSAIELGDVWEDFAEKLKGLLPFNHIALCGIDVSVGSVTVLHDSWPSGSAKFGRKQGEVFALEGTISEDLIAAKQGVAYTFDSSEQWEKEYPGAHNYPADYSVRSLIGVPLAWGGKVVATLFFHDLEPDAYAPRDLRLAERIAAQIAGPVAGSLLRGRDLELAAERETLASIASVMGSALQLSSAWAEFTDLSAKIIEFDRVVLVSVDDKTNIATVLLDSMDDKDAPNLRSSGQSYELEGTVAGNITDTASSLIINNESLSPQNEQFPGISRQGFELPFKTSLGVPLIWGGKVVACLFFSSDEISTYKDNDLLIAERIGMQIAGPVAGALLRQRDEALVQERVLLTGIGELMGGAPDIGSVFKEFTAQIQQLVTLDEMAFLEIDREMQIVKRMHTFQGSRVKHSHSLDPREFPVSGTVAERVAKTRQGVLHISESAQETQNESTEVEHSTEASSSIMVPLIWGDTVAVVFWIGRTGNHFFTDNDLALAERIAAQIAGPVAGRLLQDREDELVRERATLVGIGELVMSAPSIGVVFDEFIDRVQTLLSFGALSFIEIDHEHNVVRRIYWFHKENVDHLYTSGFVEFPLQGTMAENVATTRLGLLHNSGSIDKTIDEFPGAPLVLRSPSPRTSIMVPLIWGEEVTVAFWMTRDNEEMYTERDLALMERVAAQIAGPVAGRLLQQRDETLVREHEALAEIGVLMSSDRGVDEVFNEVSEQITELIDFDACALIRLDSRNQTVSSFSFYGDRTWDKFRETIEKDQPMEGTLAGKAMMDRAGFVYSYSDAIQMEEDFPNNPKKINNFTARTTIAVPLLWSDEVVAALWLTRIGETPFTDNDLNVAQRIATQIAGPVAGRLLRERDVALVRERVILAGIGELMGGAPDIGSAFEEFIGRVRQLTTFGAISFLEIDHVNKVVRREHSFHEKRVEHLYELGQIEFPLTGTMVEKVTGTRQGILHFSESVEETQREFPGTPTTAQYQGHRSSIMVPLIWGDKVAVAFWMTRDIDPWFTEHDLALAERIAAQIAGPVAGTIVRERDSELAEERQRREAAELKAGVLAELSETKSNFISAMSHELRTPLTSIVAFSDILSRQGEKLLKERQLQQVKVIQRNARRLEGMINELLDLSRMESGRFEIIKSTFDFASMIAESLESAELQFDAMSQSVKFEIVTEVLPVSGDRGRLLQVVNNLLNNASKYSPNDTEIEIEVTEQSGLLVLEVRDRGPGIPTDTDPGELFEMFHRADDELTRSVPGTGIGLHVAKRIIEEHGGEITIESRDDGGATARFWIPTGVNAIA